MKEQSKIEHYKKERNMIGACYKLETRENMKAQSVMVRSMMEQSMMKQSVMVQNMMGQSMMVLSMMGQSVMGPSMMEQSVMVPSMTELSTKKDKSKLVVYHKLEKNVKERSKKVLNTTELSMKKEKNMIVEQNRTEAWDHMMELSVKKMNTMVKSMLSVHIRTNMKVSNLIQQ